MWFRQDLRLHDNESLHEALQHTEETLYIYVFDRRLFAETTHHGFKRMGQHRAKFLLESVRDLRDRIRAHGAELIVRYGYPEEEIFKLAEQYRPSWVFCNRERTRHRVYVQDALETNLWSIGCELRYARGKMLYYTLDLPFPITQSPEQFSHFRKEVDRYVAIREPLADWESLPMSVDCPIAGDLPSENQLGISDCTSWLPAGETGALECVEHIANSFGRSAKSTLSRMLPEDRASLILSPYLAQGCLSPKYLYHALKNKMADTAELQKIKKLLQLRDFLRLIGKKYGNKIFDFNGTTDGTTALSRSSDQRVVNAWMAGETDFPLINALMKALKTEGYIPYKGRELVATFFIHHLKQDWTIGAEYFQHILIDYDVCSNWCSWQYLAGLGTMPFDMRSYDFQSKSKRLDPHGHYVKSWLEEYSAQSVQDIYQVV